MEIGENIEPRDVKSILQDVVSKTSKLEEESDEALHHRKDKKLTMQKLVERAEMVKDLPEEIKQATDADGLSADDWSQLEALSALAKKALEDGEYLRLTVFLTDRGSTGDPNTLESFVNQLIAKQS